MPGWALPEAFIASRLEREPDECIVDPWGSWSGPRCARWAATGLPVPVVGGVPDAWPHIAAVLREAGFRPTPERAETIYGGGLARVPAPAAPPVAGVELRRAAGDTTVVFTAVLDGRGLGVCEWDLD